MIVEEEEVRREEGVAGRVAVARARAPKHSSFTGFSPAFWGAVYACAGRVVLFLFFVSMAFLIQLVFGVFTPTL